MKNSWILLAVLTAFFFACKKAPEPDSPASKTEQTSEEQGQITVYRSDGFRPGLVSEWIEVHYQAGNKIGKILYWNTQDENPIELKINKQEYVPGEISGYTGELQFPKDNDRYGFGILEGKFKLTHPDNRMQEFEYESTK
jgi:hypothetical protein